MKEEKAVGRKQKAAQTRRALPSALCLLPSSFASSLPRRRRVTSICTDFEDQARAGGFRLIAGVDEVGRVFLPAILRD